MPATRIQMVCFDVGGVIVRHCRNWTEGCRAAGIHVPEGVDNPELIQKRREAARLHTTGRIDGPEFCRRISGLLGGVLSPEQIACIHHAWLGTEYDRIGEVVDRLVDARRARTGVLSNTNPEHWARLDPPNGGMPEFPTVRKLGNLHASHLVGIAKPDPAFYEAFERSVGLADQRASILFFDDLVENIEAAAARGWTGVLIDHTGDTASQVEAALRRFDLV
jgi:FMN phosphatase YigB (HAD superfamily)